MEKFREIGRAALINCNSMQDDTDPKTTERLFKLIDYAKDRFHWYEEQREKKLSLALSMLALSGVAMTITINSLVGNGIDQNSLQFKIILLVLLLLVLTSSSVICVYLKGQNLQYTHRKGLNSIYSWYGYGVPKIEQVGIFEYFIWGRYSALTLIHDNDPSLEMKQKQVINGFKKFTSEVTPRLYNKTLAADEDLQQIYILQIFQTISRDNLQYMVKCLKFGGFAISIATLWLGLLIIISGVPTIPKASNSIVLQTKSAS